MKFILLKAILVCIAVINISCKNSTKSLSNKDKNSTNPGHHVPQRTSFSMGMTYQWQLQGDIDTSYSVDTYDIDLEDNEHNGIIELLKSQNKKVICYFSAGTFEDWRSDSTAFPDIALGNGLGWPGEVWLDIRDERVHEIMRKRLKRASEAGCYAVEPDNVDAYQNNSGFSLTAQDQLDYLNFLARTAHSLNLSIGLKNSVGLIETGNLAQTFDFTLNEECYSYNECDKLKPFIDVGKAVFIAEYEDQLLSNCSNAINSNYELVVFNLDLAGGKRLTCD